jgi:hypothetical protein
VKWRQNYHFSTIIISNSQIETLVSFSRSTNVNVNLSFPNSNFVGNFSNYVFGKSFWHYRELKIECLTSRHNTFVCLEVRILVEKSNVYENHIFQKPLLQTCRLETTSLFLNTRLLFNKEFQMLIIFIEINVNICLLCAHHIMKCIILHTRRPNCQQKVCYAISFCFRWFFFAFWGAEKHVFHIVPFRPTRYVLKIFRCLEVSNRVRNW